MRPLSHPIVQEDFISAPVLLVANFDSGLKYADRLATAFQVAGARPEIVVPTTVEPSLLGAAQIAASTARPVRAAPWDELVAEAACAAAVVPVFVGPAIERFLSDVHRAAPSRRPVLGSGYVGMVLNDAAGGYLMRSLSDVIAVNSRSDLAEFSAVARALGLPTDNLALCGLPLLPAAPLPQRSGPIRTVVFADQPTVPARPAQRTHLWDRLLEHARLHPEREVLLRPRHGPREATFHRMELSPHTWAASRTLPPNLRLVETPITELLASTDLLLTVSSTAALEAIAAGVRVAFIADFLNDAALNPRLIPSGLLRRFDDVDAGRLGSPDPAWLDDVFPSSVGPSPAERFAAWVLALVGSDAARPHDAAWRSDYQVGRRRTDAELERILPTVGRRRFTPRRVAAGVLRRALRRVER